MTPEQFCYWMQGFAELSPIPPTPEQWKAIREHIATVFKKVTPAVGTPKVDIDWGKVTVPKTADAWPPFKPSDYVGGGGLPPKFPDIIC